MQINKRYPITSSPLYRLKNKRKLYCLLKTDSKEIKDILASKNYLVYTQTNRKTGKKRKICEPKKKLKFIQKRIQKYLSRLEIPDYVFSGKKGLCYVDNAKVHLKQKFLLNIDISSFYPNCKREYVFRVFKYLFEMDDDVAWLLTDLTTFEGTLPTGSPTSQLLAFFAYKEMFDEIYQLSNNKDYVFSLYVDDCTFSSTYPIISTIPYRVNRITKRFGHEINHKKTKFYYPKNFKTVTGCIITPSNELKVKNSQRKEIVGYIPKIKHKKITKKEIDSLLGGIQSSRQIEPNIFNGIVSLIS